MGANKFFFSQKGGVVGFNTIIGGGALGTRVNTLSSLASILTCNESDIFNFEVDGVDIKCNINVDYEINNQAFQNTYFGSNSPSFYYDLDGRCKKIGDFVFYNSLNTLNFYFPEVTEIGGFQFYHANYRPSNGLLPIKWIYMPNLINPLGAGDFNNTSRLTIFYCNDFLSTSNNGQPDPVITDGITNRGVTVFYVDTEDPNYLLSIEQLNNLHP